MKLIERWKNLQGPARASVVFVFASFLLRGVSFLTTPVFTRLLSQDAFGLVVTYNNWAAIVEVFAVLGMTSAGVFNVGLNDNRDRMDSYVSSTLVLCAGADLVSFALLFAVKRLFPGLITLTDPLLLLMCLHFLLYPAQVFWITRERYVYRYRAAVIVSVLSTVLSQVAAIIAVVLGPKERGGEIKLWSGEAVTLLFSLPVYILLLKKGRCFWDPAGWKKVLAYALPLLPHYLAQHVMTNADRIMVSSLVSEAAAAVYSLGVTVSLMMTLIWNAVNASLIPYTYDGLNRKDPSGIRRLSVPLVLCYGGLCFALVLVTPEVFLVLAPENYHAGIFAVPPVAAVAFLSCLYNLFAGVEFYYKRTGWIAGSTVAAAIVNVALNAVFIPRFGFIAAAYTTLVSYLVLLVMHYIGYRKCAEMPVYPVKTLVAVSAAVVAACLLCSLAYETPVLRYALALAVVVLAVVKRKTILARIREMKAKKEPGA